MEPAVRGVIDFAKEGGGAPECSVLGFGGRLPAVMAAFANGAMAHCLDYDDQTPWGQHSGSSILPAVFAVCERQVARGGHVAGRDMIAAIAVGQDLFHRLIPNVGWRKDWNFSTVVGVYCATAACTHLLSLSREQVANAFGIASMQSCGTMAVINATGSDLRALYAGFPARGAVTAALLAEKGVSGVPTIFEGEFGIFAMYFGNQYDRSKIVDGLGTSYSGGRTLYKQWPAVGTSHSHVHATIGLVRDHGIDALADRSDPRLRRGLSPPDVRAARYAAGADHAGRGQVQPALPGGCRRCARCHATRGLHARGAARPGGTGDGLQGRASGRLELGLEA